MADPRTVTISLPPELAAQVDAAAATEGRSRSELFREAARQYLRSREQWTRLYAYGEHAAERAGVTGDDEVAAAITERRRTARPDR